MIILKGRRMKYTKVRHAIFLNRPNRFIAHVLLDGREEIVHVKNTGRCREILREGTEVILEEGGNPDRKTRYSIIAAYKGDMLINIDSQAPNRVVYDAIKEGRLTSFSNTTVLSREVTFGNSRFDIYFENSAQKGFIEVKGVTLERDGIALFPDAPTERGARHAYEMAGALKEGYAGCIFFLLQLKGAKYFTPNKDMDYEFFKALSEAKRRGVGILAFDSVITENSIELGGEIRVVI